MLEVTVRSEVNIGSEDISVIEVRSRKIADIPTEVLEGLARVELVRYYGKEEADWYSLELQDYSATEYSAREFMPRGRG